MKIVFKVISHTFLFLLRKFHLCCQRSGTWSCWECLSASLHTALGGLLPFQRGEWWKLMENSRQSSPGTGKLPERPSHGEAGAGNPKPLGSVSPPGTAEAEGEMSTRRVVVWILIIPPGWENVHDNQVQLLLCLWVTLLHFLGKIDRCLTDSERKESGSWFGIFVVYQSRNFGIKYFRNTYGIKVAFEWMEGKP